MWKILVFIIFPLITLFSKSISSPIITYNTISEETYCTHTRGKRRRLSMCFCKLTRKVFISISFIIILKVDYHYHWFIKGCLCFNDERKADLLLQLKLNELELSIELPWHTNRHILNYNSDIAESSSNCFVSLKTRMKN